MSRFAMGGMRVCHPFGNPFSYNAAIGFLGAEQLTQFHTTIYSPLRLRKRFHPQLPANVVTTHPVWEMARLAATRLPLGRWTGRRQNFVDLVATRFDQSTAAALRPSDGAVYCYEDSACASFHKAATLGVARVYELPILHYREMQSIFKMELAKEPGLGPFFESLREPDAKLERKDQELLTADVIVVPSTLVRRSIERFLSPRARFVLAPYGSDVKTAAKVWNGGDQEGPIRLFFAGILGPRKGLHILFEALSKLPAAQFQLALGGRWVPGFREWLDRRYNVNYEWLGQLAHEGVYEACRRSHVFVFPSLAEGFGLVILEAMASGIPVIASTHTAGPDVIDQGVDGWVVPAGDAEALRECLETVMEQRGALPEYGRAARQKAESMDWGRYRADLPRKVMDALASASVAGSRDAMQTL